MKKERLAVHPVRGEPAEPTLAEILKASPAVVAKAKPIYTQ